MMLASCEDKLDYGAEIIGDGEALVEATLEFKSSVTKLGSRTSGTEISEINSLSIVIYDSEKALINVINDIPFKKNNDTTETPSDYPEGDDVKSEPSTASVSFNYYLPYGKYYIYAVANLGRDLTKSEVQTIEQLKNIECSWDDDNIANNAQMFGYFTNAESIGDTPASLPNKDKKEDPAVIINKTQVSLYCWVKRLASKVTVAFDGSKLHSGIYVYIHNVSIRQIPLSCKLGVDNTPRGNEDVSNPYYGEVTPAYYHESVPTLSQVLYYNSDGTVADNKPGDYDTSLYGNWLTITNGAGPNGDGRGLGSDHSNTSPALFFYENMQGNYENYPEDEKIWYNKMQNPDSVGTNIGPENKDYRDNIEYGTFVEVEAYYKCDIHPISNGPIRYRFMLGQNTTYDYDAIRNHHYKVTLGFNGYANQPDWHIDYEEETPEVFTPEVYIPYTYNTSVQLPVRFNGNLVGLTAEIIENNWAPYDESEEEEVPARDSYGETNFNTRTLEFVWYRSVFINNGGYTNPLNPRTGTLSNASGNYLYGRHRSVDSDNNPLYHLDEDGNNLTDKPYYVSPIWAGFFRLMQPTEYEDENVQIPPVLLPNTSESGSNNYSSSGVLGDFRNYFFGKMTSDSRGSEANTTDLSKRTFHNLNEGTWGNGRNAYIVEKETIDGVESTTVTMNIWTQPKSMCGISGFSGNNPYEDYNRKGVVRFTATFQTSEGRKIIKRDVTLIQAKRLVNPKAVWRRHDNPEDFNVTLMERNLTDDSRLTFQPVISRGEWRARIKKGDESFISLIPQGSANSVGKDIVGKTLSEIKFKIDFTGEVGYTESKCAIIEVTYHGNTCVHNIFVRQGYHQPLQLSTDTETPSPYWSSYNVYSCDPNTTYGEQTAEIPAVLTRSPLSFGAFFKKGNYAQGISVSNISRTGLGPLQSPGSNTFTLTGTNPPAPRTWTNIQGVAGTTGSALNWHWSKFNVTLNYQDENGISQSEQRIYRVPTIAEFNTLLEDDFGIGVMYGDGADAPADNTTEAFGYLDPDNTTISNGSGMRGFICYNPDNANQIFFPIGTSGIGRRTSQGTDNANQFGTLRYSSVNFNLNGSASSANTMRPICVNMLNAPGSIYWANQPVGTDANASSAWELNYFDLNFNAVTQGYTSGTGDDRGDYGDALPIRLVLDGTPQ